MGFEVLCKLHLLHATQLAHRPKRSEFVTVMLDEINNGGRFLQKILSRDETTFHICVHVYYHSVRLWAVENPLAYVENYLNTPKMNVWCGQTHNKVIGPFYFPERTLTSITWKLPVNCIQCHNFQKELSFNKTAVLHNMDIFFVSFCIHFPSDG